MKFNDYINFDADKIYNNQEFSISYSGYLNDLATNDDPVVIRLGDQNWGNVQDVEMFKEDGVFKADLSISNFKQMNFCFKHGNSWDNNFNKNFNINIYDKIYDANNIKEEYIPINYHNFLSDDFLMLYNINNEERFDVNKEREESVKSKYLNSESNIFENASNISSPEIELQNLKETLERLFPEDETEKVQVVETIDTTEAISKKFSEYFTNENVYNIAKEAFKEIDAEVKRSEVYIPIVPYRKRLLEITKEREARKKQNVSMEEDSIVLIARMPYIEKFRTIVKEREIAKILDEAKETQDSTFLVVSPYSDMDIYDNSIIGRLKSLKATILKAFRKLNNYLQKRARGESEDNIN